MGMIEHCSEKTEFYTDERCHITELHNTAADESCSIARARVQPGVSTRLHRLQGTIERYVILEGVARVCIGGAPAVEVRPLDVVTIPAGAGQCISNCGATDLVFLCICTPRYREQNYVDMDDG